MSLDAIAPPVPMMVPSGFADRTVHPSARLLHPDGTSCASINPFEPQASSKFNVTITYEDSAPQHVSAFAPIYLTSFQTPYRKSRCSSLLATL
jgi:hypothetical protein